jgi:hypothetical protein
LLDPYNLFSGGSIALSSLLSRDDVTGPLKEFLHALGSISTPMSSTCWTASMASR